jgi:hypothetical protein
VVVKQSWIDNCIYLTVARFKWFIDPLYMRGFSFIMYKHRKNTI